jgi:hypothetical protein
VSRPEPLDVSNKKKSFDNMSGAKVGEITILYPIATPEHVGKTNRNQYYWAQCSCGKEYAVSSRTLKRPKRSDPSERGATACVDCAHKLRIEKFLTPHGQCYSRLYRIWKNIKVRCSSEHGTLTHGIRGISVCDAWLDFIPFFEWSLAHHYEEALSLDRIDVDGPYSPENCRWVLPVEQNYNKRNTYYIEINGERVSLAQYYYAEPRLVSYSVISNRFRSGWSLEEAFSIPYGCKRKGGSIKKLESKPPTVSMERPKEAPISERRKNWTGAQLGEISILYPIAPPDYIKNKYNPDQFFWAACSCGKEYIISHRTIMKGVTACKQCTMKRVGASLRMSDGKRKKRLRKIWLGMKRRCRTVGVRDYREKGVRVCNEWYEDFWSFFNWSIEHNYDHNLTLDRIDVTGNYCPENCRWTTRQCQAFNKSNTLYTTYQGERWSLSELYHHLGSDLPYTTVYSRHNRGWDGDRIFSTPYKDKYKK